MPKDLLFHIEPNGDKPDYGISSTFKPVAKETVVTSPMQKDGASPSMTGNVTLRDVTGSSRSRDTNTSDRSRFGALSYNSFFTRHSPHPVRLTHIKGLWNAPICVVNDGGYIANPRYSLQFPPDNFTQNKLLQWRTPVNSQNITARTQPINDVTGMQWFMGKRINNRYLRRKPPVKGNTVQEFEAWRDELKALSAAVGLDLNSDKKPSDEKTGTAGPRTSQYSAATGRLIPASSKSRSRTGHGSRSGTGRRTATGMLGVGIEEPDIEVLLLQMLAQILQTDDERVVKAWLVSAPDKEKTAALEMLRAVLDSNTDLYRPDAIGGWEGTLLPGVEARKNGKVDRLVVDEMKGDRDVDLPAHRPDEPVKSKVLPFPPNQHETASQTVMNGTDENAHPPKTWKPDAATTEQATDVKNDAENGVRVVKKTKPKLTLIMPPNRNTGNNELAEKANAEQDAAMLHRQPLRRANTMYI